MSINIGSDFLSQYNINSANNTANTDKLKQALENSTSTEDAELMEVCKSFESYLVEQVFKSMKSSVPKSEGEGSEYVNMFEDMMNQQYADDAVNSQGFGIAQMLYESMKRGN